MSESQYVERQFPMPTPLPLGRIEVRGKPVGNGDYLHRRDVATALESQRRDIQSALRADKDRPAVETDTAEAIEELLVASLCLMLWHMQKVHSKSTSQWITNTEDPPIKS